MGEKRNACNILVGILQGKRSLGGPRRRWKENIKMNLQETTSEGVDWIHVAQYRFQRRDVVNTAMNLVVPWKASNFLIS
jgi:hypothetical protein